LKLVELTSKVDADRSRIAEELATLTARMGEIEGLIVTIRTKDGYEYIRVGFNYLEAIGMLDRHKHSMHVAWDEEPR